MHESFFQRTIRIKNERLKIKIMEQKYIIFKNILYTTLYKYFTS